MNADTAIQTRPITDETPPDVTREKLLKYLNAFGLASQLTDEETEQFVEVCLAYQLDPFRKEVHCVPYGQGDNRRLSIIVGYETYLRRAENSHCLDGWSVWTEGTGEEMKAIVEIRRKDWSAPFRHEVPWTEAAQYTRDGTLTSFWRRMPKFQLKKVAIAQGFRLAFPDELAGAGYDPAELPSEMSSERDVTPHKPTQPNQPSPQADTAPITIGIPRSESTVTGPADPRVEALKKRLADNEDCFTKNHLAWVQAQLDSDQSDRNLSRMEKHIDEVIKRRKVEEPLQRIQDEITDRQTAPERAKEPAPIF
jgi:phage recombination protein Bet